jgi:inorganic pyrophosphatase
MITEYIRVFIENEAGKNKKNYYNEKTLDYLKSIEVSREYPYPYGFILNTTNQDGDNLDCYIITNRFLKKGQIIICIPIAILEQLEDGIEDNNILAVLPEDKNKIYLNKDIIKNITDFILHVFENIPGKKIEIGNILGEKETLEHIKKCLD